MQICTCVAPVLWHAHGTKTKACRRCGHWWMPEEGSKPAVTREECHTASKRLHALLVKPNQAKS